MAIHLMETLNIRSLPSPGIVTSKSTCNGPRKQDELLNFGFLPLIQKCNVLSPALHIPGTIQILNLELS